MVAVVVLALVTSKFETNYGCGLRMEEEEETHREATVKTVRYYCSTVDYTTYVVRTWIFGVYCTRSLLVRLVRTYRIT